MTHVGTDPRITETERNGLPEGEPQTLECGCCHEAKPEKQVKDMRVCEACQTAADDRKKLRDAIEKALSNMYWGEHSTASARLENVLKETA